MARGGERDLSRIGKKGAPRRRIETNGWKRGAEGVITQ